MINKIVVEGMWSHGKSTLSRGLCQELGFGFIQEPIYPGDENSPDTNDWYIQAHRKNQEEFYRDPNEKLVMERSVLSSGAFLYASKEDLTRIIPYLEQLGALNRQTPTAVVFLYSSEKTANTGITLVANQKIAKLLENPEFVRRYIDFFQKETGKYGITPLSVNIDNSTGLKNSDQVLQEVIRSLKVRL